MKRFAFVLFAVLALSVIPVCAETQAEVGSDSVSYEGADLELFEFLCGSTWSPKPKGFEVVSPVLLFSKMSERMTFKDNGEVWYKSGSYGSVEPFRIKDGVIIFEGNRITYDAENDQLKDLISGRVYKRVGEKPAVSDESGPAEVADR